MYKLLLIFILSGNLHAGNIIFEGDFKNIAQWEVLPGTNYKIDKGILYFKESLFQERPVDGYFYGIKSKFKIKEGIISADISSTGEYWSHYIGKYNRGDDAVFCWLDPIARKIELRHAFCYYASVGFSDPISYKPEEWHNIKIVITSRNYNIYWDENLILSGKERSLDGSKEASIILGGVLYPGNELKFKQVKIISF